MQNVSTSLDTMGIVTVYLSPNMSLICTDVGSDTLPKQDRHVSYFVYTVQC